MDSIKNLTLLISNYTKTDLGLLLMRITFGSLMFYSHGLNKILAGTERWNRLGGALTDLIGLSSLKPFFGFMASFSESVCALLIVLGLFTRLSSFLLFFTMLIASVKHFADGDLPEMALLYGIFCLFLILTGPGKYSLDKKYFSNYFE